MRKLNEERIEILAEVDDDITPSVISTSKTVLINTISLDIPTIVLERRRLRKQNKDNSPGFSTKSLNYYSQISKEEQKAWQSPGRMEMLTKFATSYRGRVLRMINALRKFE